MKQQIHLSILMILIAMVLVSCASQGVAEPSATPEVPHGGEVEDQASLSDSLRAAGAEVAPGDPVEQPFFSVTGQSIKVNGQDVQVFEYANAEAMEAEASQVSPDGSSVGTSMMMWVATPHFYKAGRVLALYVGDDTATIELLSSVIGEQFAGR